MLTNIFWRLLQQYSGFVVNVVVQTVLARILMPADFGIVAIVMAFVGIADTFAISGLGTALVQKKEPDEQDYATVLCASMFFSFILYFILFFLAPFIAVFYDSEGLTVILRVLGITIFAQTYTSIQTAYIQKSFAFKQSCLGNLIASVLVGSVSIWLAYDGYGLWSLITYNILKIVVAILVVQFFLRWHPAIGFDFRRFKEMYSFAWKMLVSGLLGSLLENFYSMSIGRFYGHTALGFYNRGICYPQAVLGQPRIALNAVMLPEYSKYQSQPEYLCSAVRRMTFASVFLIFPMVFGLVAVAEPFVKLFLTDKWLPCVFFLRLECIFYGALAISSSLGQAIVACGCSDINVRIEAIKLCATVCCIAVLYPFGVRWLCAGRVVIAALIIFYVVNIARRLFGYSIFELADDLWRPFCASAVMGLIVYFVQYLPLRVGLVFCLQIVVGIVSYYGLSYVLMREELLMLQNKIFQFLRRN